MAEIIHEHVADRRSGNGMGFLLGVLLLIVVVVLLIYYGLPLIRNAAPTYQVNVPDKVDVQVNQPQQPQ